MAPMIIVLLFFMFKDGMRFLKFFKTFYEIFNELNREMNLFMMNFSQARRIDYSCLKEREKIYEYYIKVHPYFSNKLLDYLEANIKDVEGEYPNDELFKISKNENHDRLAKLELKWRKLE